MNETTTRPEIIGTLDMDATMFLAIYSNYLPGAASNGDPAADRVVETRGMLVFNSYEDAENSLEGTVPAAFSDLYPGAFCTVTIVEFAPIPF